MKRLINWSATLFVAVVVFMFACSDPNVDSVSDSASGAPKAGASFEAGAPSAKGIEPDAFAGNFVASDDDQVCYELVSLGIIDEVSSEMRGFKIDPPIGLSEGDVLTTISANERFLDWESSANASVIAFVVKGGAAYNVYDYVGTGYSDDQNLHAPGTKDKKGVFTYPAISHYNFCYILEPGDDQGCTPGYWRNHADRWVGVASADDFDTTFGVSFFAPDITLGVAIWANGGGYNALARHATAALLNAHAKESGSNGQFVNFPYTVAEVIAKVQSVADGADLETVKNELAAANELGCPLNGTSAVPVN